MVTMTTMMMMVLITIMMIFLPRLTTWENLLDSISHVGPLTTNPIQVKLLLILNFVKL